MKTNEGLTVNLINNIECYEEEECVKYAAKKYKCNELSVGIFYDAFDQYLLSKGFAVDLGEYIKVKDYLIDPKDALNYLKKHTSLSEKLIMKLLKFEHSIHKNV